MQRLALPLSDGQFHDQGLPLDSRVSTLEALRGCSLQQVVTGLGLRRIGSFNFKGTTDLFRDRGIFDLEAFVADSFFRKWQALLSVIANGHDGN